MSLKTGSVEIQSVKKESMGLLKLARSLLHKGNHFCIILSDANCSCYLEILVLANAECLLRCYVYNCIYTVDCYKMDELTFCLNWIEILTTLLTRMLDPALFYFLHCSIHFL